MIPGTMSHGSEQVDIESIFFSLPRGWTVKPLGQVAELSKKPRGLPLLEGGQVPFIPMAMLPDDGLYATGWELRKQEEIRSGTFFHKGDVLLAKITPCLENGKQGIVKDIPTDWGYASTEVFPIHPVEITAEFLASFLKQSNVRHSLAIKMQGTTGRQRLPKEVLQSLPIPVPPIVEQRAIGRLLQMVQQAKEATEKVIAATKELKKSLMRHLLTYGPVPIDQAEQVKLKETEIGRMPEHWRLVQLNQLIHKPEYGLTASATESPVGPKFLRITDIQDGGVNWNAVPFCKCSEREFSKLSLREGDIVVARIGATTGKTFLMRSSPDAVFASYLIRIRVKPVVEPEFLYRFTETGRYWEQIDAAKGGRLKQGVNIPVLQGLRIPLPPLSQQREIARRLSAVDGKLEAEEMRRTALGHLFHSLLYHLMTGQVRLPEFAGEA